MILAPLTRAQIDIWAAESICDCAPPMSARTDVMEAEDWRLDRWCWESLNAATCLQETRMGFCSVRYRIVLAKHLVADDQVRSVLRSVE